MTHASATECRRLSHSVVYIRVQALSSSGRIKEKPVGGTTRRGAVGADGVGILFVTVHFGALLRQGTG